VVEVSETYYTIGMKTILKRKQLPEHFFVYAFFNVNWLTLFHILLFIEIFGAILPGNNIQGYKQICFFR
jgi:hypothetical protein